MRRTHIRERRQKDKTYKHKKTGQNTEGKVKETFMDKRQIDRKDQTIDKTE